MKNFFKSKTNITILTFICIAVLFLVLSLVFSPLIVGCLISLSIICFLVSSIFIRRYHRIKEFKKDNVNINGQVFDATEYSYDEDVYVVPDDNKKVIKRKISLGLDSLSPAILFIVVGVVLFGMAISVFFV